MTKVHLYRCISCPKLPHDHNVLVAHNVDRIGRETSYGCPNCGRLMTRDIGYEKATEAR